MTVHAARIAVRGGWRLGLLASASLIALCASSDRSFAASAGEEANNFVAAGPGTTEVVFVTARRQVERAQDVPISLTAVSGARMEAAGINTILRLNQLVPSLQVLSFNPRNTSITIRGLGANIGIVNDGIEAGVGVYVDGVLHARPAAGTFELPDIASVEVLRGPQGTLYGKNSVAGAININTLVPTSVFEAYGRISLGDYGYKSFYGTVSGPLDSSGRWTGRFSALYSDRDGFFTNVFDGKTLDDYRDYSVRAQLQYRRDDFSLRLIADHSYFNSQKPVRVISGVVTTLANGQTVPRNFNQRAAAAGYTPLPIDPYARRMDANSEIRSKMWQGGLSAHADWTLNGFTLSSISAFRYWTWRPKNDDDLTSLTVLAEAQQEDDERQVSQEFRITSPAGRAIEYTGGLFYFWEQTDGDGHLIYGPDAPLWVLGNAGPLYQAALNGFTITADSVPRINSYAAYGQATWHATANLDVTAGLRYTYEDKTGGYDQRVSGASIAGFTPTEQAQIMAMRNLFGAANAYSVETTNALLGGLVTFAYRVNNNFMTYATYSHGEKSAGLNLANLVIAVPKIVEPESVDNYEIGFKSSLADSRVTFNANLFWTDDTNYQTTLLDVTNFSIYLANIPQVRSRGFEIDANANPFEGLRVYMSAAYTDAYYVSYPNAPAPFESFTVSAGRLVTNVPVNLSSRQLPATSRWALSGGGEYSGSLAQWGLGGVEAYVGVDESYRSSYFSNSSLSLHSRVDGYALTNLRVGFRADDGRWDLQFWSRNLFDRQYIIARTPTLFNSGALATLLGDPRTVGASFAMRM